MSTELRRQSNTHQETMLAEAIERLLAGEDRDSILMSAEGDADWLGPLLTAFAAVRGLKQRAPIPPADASLARFLAQGKRAAAEASRQPALSRWWASLIGGMSRSMGAFPRLAATAVAAVLVVLTMTLGSALFLGAPSASAAEDVLPGQWIYPVKRLGEQVYLWLPQSSQSRSLRMVEYAERRRAEVRGLVNRSLAASVDFRGLVEELGPTQVVVDGFALRITDETRVEGPLAVGAHVWVRARTLVGGALVAQSLSVEQPALPTEVPTVAPTAQPTATVAPSPTASPSSTPSSLPSMPVPTSGIGTGLGGTPTEAETEEASEQPAGVPRGEPTAAPSPPPTATREPTVTPTHDVEPTEDHSGPGGGGGQPGEGGDDNANDNEGPGGGDDNANDNQGPGGGDDNTGDDGNSGDGNGHEDDNQGSDDNDHSGDGNSGSDDSGNDSSGGDDHSGSDDSGSDDSGDDSGSGSDNDD